MSSEFGVLRKAFSDGHQSLRSTTKKLSIHRRAKSLFSLRSTTSINDTWKLFPNRSSCPPSATSTPTKRLSIEGPTTPDDNSLDEQRRKKLAHRRFQWTGDDDNWRLFRDVLAKENLDPDTFLGLALTTPYSPADGNIPSPDYIGRRQTEQCLRFYHRPTEINVELITRTIRNTKRRSLKPASPVKASSTSSSTSTIKPAFKGHYTEWSPALLSPEKSLIDGNFASSSALTYGLPISRKKSWDGQQEIWRVSTEDDDLSFLVPTSRWI